MSNEELTRKALALPLSDRIDLAQALWHSIEELAEDEDNAEERKALEQARKRDRELASGAVEGRTHQQVMEAARGFSICPAGFAIRPASLASQPGIPASQPAGFVTQSGIPASQPAGFASGPGGFASQPAG